MATAYIEDSWDDHGVNKCPGPEFVRRVMAGMVDGGLTCSHHMDRSLVNIDGDTAGAETNFMAVTKTPGGGDGGEDQLHLMGGRYIDRLLRIEGEWKIKHRTCVRDWSISLRVAEDWAGTRGFVAGQQSGSDPSYSVLGLQHNGPGEELAMRMTASI